ncbi:MAG TPA: VWA domain-containing protein [Candidatus Sumerlaeota bacterium]|nr:VWA domain-containing protein [Candidatus Sumerlaeota bacterium]
MRFASQAVLYGLFTLPLILLFQAWVLHRKRTLLYRLGNRDLVSRLAEGTSPSRQAVRAGLLALALLLLITSLSRPQYGTIERPMTRKGVDIFIAMDTSLSMLARDIKPNRLARAKEQLRGVIHRLQGDRVGIIAFAGTAIVQCPLTMDYGLALSVLDTVDDKSVPVPGTAIGEAIRAAVQAFGRASTGDRVIILLTDGEDQQTNPLGAADEAARAGVRIYSIGIGSEKGEPIPLETGSFKQDEKGHVVNSRLDLDLLTKISEKTKGMTLKANPTGGLELDAIYADIGLLDKAELRTATFTIHEDRFQLFLLPAILLLLLEMVLPERRKRRVPAAALAAAALLLCGFKLTDEVSDQTRAGNRALSEGRPEEAIEHYLKAQAGAPESPQVLFNIGRALMEQGKHDEAAEAFLRADAMLKEPDERAAAWYNLGVTRHRQAEQDVAQQKIEDAIKKLEQAMEANRKAARLSPDNEDPRFNYQQNKKLYEMLKQMQQQQQQQQDKNDKQDEQKNDEEKQDREKDSEEKQKEQEQQQDKQQENQQGKQQDEQQKSEQEQQQDQKQTGEKESEEEQKQDKQQKAGSEEEQKESEEKPSGQAEPEEKIGEMSPEDAMRILGTLPPEDREALKDALMRRYRRMPGTSRDW